MQIKAETIFKAMPVITAIIDQSRPMPQAGKYRLARMHAKLLPEYTLINEARNDLIKAYNHHPMVPRGSEITPAGIQALRTELGADDKATDPLDQRVNAELNKLVVSKEFSVPAEHMPAFEADVAKLFAELVEVQINPIPISMLSPADAPNGSIEASEISVMDELLTDLEVVR